LSCPRPCFGCFRDLSHEVLLLKLFGHG
jgi:hypothetical protein